MGMNQPAVVNTLGRHWGAQLSKRRLDLTLTQAELAEVVGVAQQTISKIEKGEIIPHDKLKLRIAQRTGSNVQTLWAWPPADDLGAA